jgi:hypothetical protein
MVFPPLQSFRNVSAAHTRLAREQIHNCGFGVLGRLLREFVESRPANPGWLLLAHQSIAELAFRGVALIQYNKFTSCLFLSRRKTSFVTCTALTASLMPKESLLSSKLSGHYVAGCVTRMFHARLYD